MSRILVTGAQGYIGRALTSRLVERVRAGRAESLTLFDLHAGAQSGSVRDPRVRCVSGDLLNTAALTEATQPAPDLVFHLAGVTSRQAEDDFTLGLQVNVLGSIALFDRLRSTGARPVLVCASSIGVYGTPLPAAIDDDTPCTPTLSYGAQKRIVETLLADYTRRGWLDGRAVRLPSVVARPAPANGALSSFASDLIREVAHGRRYTCPIGPEGTLWLLSLPACVDNLLHAADLAAQGLPPGRAWNLPALRASAAEIVQALGRCFPAAAADCVTYQPIGTMQAQFAQWPPLATPLADRLGFRHDGDLATLIHNALRD